MISVKGQCNDQSASCLTLTSSDTAEQIGKRGDEVVSGGYSIKGFEALDLRSKTVLDQRAMPSAVRHPHSPYTGVISFPAETLV